MKKIIAHEQSTELFEKTAQLLGVSISELFEMDPNVVCGELEFRAGLGIGIAIDFVELLRKYLEDRAAAQRKEIETNLTGDIRNAVLGMSTLLDKGNGLSDSDLIAIGELRRLLKPFPPKIVYLWLKIVLGSERGYRVANDFSLVDFSVISSPVPKRFVGISVASPFIRAQLSRLNRDLKGMWNQFESLRVHVVEAGIERSESERRSMIYARFRSLINDEAGNIHPYHSPAVLNGKLSSIRKKIDNLRELLTSADAERRWKEANFEQWSALHNCAANTTESTERVRKRVIVYGSDFFKEGPDLPATLLVQSPDLDEFSSIPRADTAAIQAETLKNLIQIDAERAEASEMKDALLMELVKLDTTFREYLKQQAGDKKVQKESFMLVLKVRKFVKELSLLSMQVSVIKDFENKFREFQSDFYASIDEAKNEYEAQLRVLREELQTCRTSLQNALILDQSRKNKLVVKIDELMAQIDSDFVDPDEIELKINSLVIEAKNLIILEKEDDSLSLKIRLENEIQETQNQFRKMRHLDLQTTRKIAACLNGLLEEIKGSSCDLNIIEARLLDVREKLGIPRS